jgi:hypothetical protein
LNRFPVTLSFEEKTMKTTTTNLIAIVTIIAVGLAASTASADNKKNNNKKSGFSISFGGGSNHNGNHNHNWHHNFYPHHNTVKKVYVVPKVYPIYDTCYYPQHRICYVLPGDTWYTISQREYGNQNFCHNVASYNGLAMNSQLYVGQQLSLPEIHPNGVLKASTAPMAAPFVPAVTPAVTQNFVSPAVNAAPAVPAANIRQATEEPALPSVSTGSVIVLEGQSLGSDQGIVRLRLSEVALPIEVLEWTNTSAKVRLPQMDLSGAMRAEIEVLRADGSLASKSAVQLTLAAAGLAANTAQGN